MDIAYYSRVADRANPQEGRNYLLKKNKPRRKGSQKLRKAVALPSVRTLRATCKPTLTTPMCAIRND
jgi:hypothetical protein